MKAFRNARLSIYKLPPFRQARKTAWSFIEPSPGNTNHILIDPDSAPHRLATAGLHAVEKPLFLGLLCRRQDLNLHSLDGN